MNEVLFEEKRTCGAEEERFYRGRRERERREKSEEKKSATISIRKTEEKGKPRKFEKGWSLFDAIVTSTVT